jgi:hypothetical protein
MSANTHRPTDILTMVHAVADMRGIGMSDVAIAEALKLNPRFLSSLSAGGARTAHGVTDDATGAHSGKERS